MKNVINIPYGKELNNYPVIPQYTTPLCWACTIASMVKYEFPTTYQSISKYDVCKVAKCYTGAEWDKIILALKYYFKKPYVILEEEDYLTKSEIIEVIGNDDPALMSSLNPKQTSAHITALVGYRDIYSNMAIKIMNPGTGKLEWGNYSNNAPFSYAFNGERYTWDKSIRLYYNE